MKCPCCESVQTEMQVTIWGTVAYVCLICHFSFLDNSFTDADVNTV